MNAKSIPIPAPEDLATEQLVAAVESAIAGIQERLANFADDSRNAKWSVSDLVKLLDLRNQLQEEQPRTITVRWVDNPRTPRDSGNNNNDNGQPKPGTQVKTCIDAHRNKGARK